MIIKRSVRQVAATVRHAVPGVLRVALARRDGTPFSDDGPDGDHERFAALVAAITELSARTSEAVRLGELRSSVVRSAEGTVLVVPVGSTWALAVVAEPQVNIVLLDRVLGPQAEHLIALDLGPRG